MDQLNLLHLRNLKGPLDPMDLFDPWPPELKLHPEDPLLQLH